MILLKLFTKHNLIILLIFRFKILTNSLIYTRIILLHWYTRSRMDNTCDTVIKEEVKSEIVIKQEIKEECKQETEDQIKEEFTEVYDESVDVKYGKYYNI